MNRKKTRFPPGWDAKKVQRVLKHYEGQSDDEAVAEDEAAMKGGTRTIMKIPRKLAPVVRELIAKGKERVAHEKKG